MADAEPTLFAQFWSEIEPTILGDGASNLQWGSLSTLRRNS
jgi:hypothetical protein